MHDTQTFNQQQSRRMLDQVSELAERLKLTESSKNNYISWILRYMRFHQLRHPTSLNKADIEAFLSHLADELNYDARVQSNAASALLFLYQELFSIDLGKLTYSSNSSRRGYAKRYGEKHCQAIIDRMQGTTQLMTRLLVMANLKLEQVIQLRLADIDLKKNQIIVRHANGERKFTTNIPLSLVLDLRIQIIKVHRQVQQEKQRELADSDSELEVLAKHLEPEWQYLFPYSVKDPGTNQISFLNQTPLWLLKNDIQLAIKHYNQFPNENRPSKFHLAATKTISKRVTQILQQRSSKLPYKTASPQVSFNFEQELGTA